MNLKKQDDRLCMGHLWICNVHIHVHVMHYAKHCCTILVWSVCTQVCKTNKVLLIDAANMLIDVFCFLFGTVLVWHIHVNTV